MSEDRIDSIIDLQKVQDELSTTKKGIQELVALIQSIKGKSIDVVNASNIGEVKKLQKELEGLKAQANNTTTAIVTTTKAVQSQTQSLEENIKKQSEYKDRISDISAELKTLKAAQDIVNKSTAPGNEDEKKEIQEKIDLLNQELAIKKVLDREISKTITNQIKESEGLNDTTKAINDQVKANILLEKSKQEVAKTLQAEANATEALEKAKIAEAKVTGELNKSVLDAARLNTEAAKAKVEELRAATESAKAKTEEARIATESAKVKTEEARAQKELSAAKFNDAKIATEATKQKILETKETERNVKAKEKEAAASAKAAQKVQEEQRPYRQLALAFASAAKEAQDLGAKYGTMDKRSQAAAKRANELNNELKKIDYTIGNSQRNVGNYPKTFDKIGLSIKSLATNFLALAGVTSIGFLFKSSIDEFVEMEKNTRQLQNTLKNLGVPEAFDRISDASDRLAKKFKFIDNDEIIKSFNQLIVYGKLTEKQINELIPVIIDFATASGQDLQSATSLVIKSLEGNGKALKEYGINMKDAKSTTEAFSIIMKELKPRVDGVAESFGDTASGGLASATQEFKNLKEEIGSGLLPVLNKVLTFFNDAIKGAKELANDISLLFSGGADAVAADFDKKTTQGALNNIEERFRKLDVDKRLDERNKLQVAIGNQRKLLADLETGTLAKEGLGDEKRIKQIKTKIEFNQRLLDILFKIQNEEGAPSKVLGIGDADDPFKETNKKNNATKKAAELAERIRKANFEAAKAAQEELIKLQEETFKDESKTFDERIAALRQFVQEKARLIELERTFEKGAKDLTKEEIVAIEVKKQTELNQLLRDGHSEYNKILEGQKKKEEQQHKDTADRIKKIHEDLQKAIEKGLKEADDRLKERNKEREDFEKERAGLRAQLVEETEGLIFDILKANFDKQKNLVQDDIDLLEKKKQKEIEVANATITNAQDKAAAITVINDRAAAQEAILEQKKRQIDVQRARFEKAESIANIITKTAEAIISTLATTPLPAGAPLAFLIGAIGAAQLARVVATPIPKFRHGTDNHKGGLMIVGDGGKSEGIELPDGTVMKSPSVPTVMDAPKGTKVYKDYSKMMLKATLTNVPVYKETTRTDQTANEVKSMKQEVVRAIKKIPQPIIRTENIISRRIRSGNNSTNYVA